MHVSLLVQNRMVWDIAHLRRKNPSAKLVCKFQRTVSFSVLHILRSFSPQTMGSSYVDSKKSNRYELLCCGLLRCDSLIPVHLTLLLPLRMRGLGHECIERLVLLTGLGLCPHDGLVPSIASECLGQGCVVVSWSDEKGSNGITWTPL